MNPAYLAIVMVPKIESNVNLMKAKFYNFKVHLAENDVQ